MGQLGSPRYGRTADFAPIRRASSNCGFLLIASAVKNTMGSRGVPFRLKNYRIGMTEADIENSACLWQGDATHGLKLDICPSRTCSATRGQGGASIPGGCFQQIYPNIQRQAGLMNPTNRAQARFIPRYSPAKAHTAPDMASFTPTACCAAADSSTCALMEALSCDPKFVNPACSTECSKHRKATAGSNAGPGRYTAPVVSQILAGLLVSPSFRA